MRFFILMSMGLFMSLSLHAAPAPVKTVETHQPFASYIQKLKASISAHKMGIVAEACATCGAEKIGIKIAGNRVIMIFNPHFAVRMLKASIPAGVEAPLRLYVTENKDGTAQLSYQLPSDVFSPYENDALNEMAQELDQIVDNIVKKSVK